MMMRKMCTVHKVAWVLLMIGGLNWGLVALLGYDALAGALGGLARIVYGLVGLSALSMLGIGKCCMKGGMCMCADEKCTHCLPAEKKEMPGMPMGEKKM